MSRSRKPDDAMSLRPGRVEQMVQEAHAHDGAIPCHETLNGPQAVCRGFFELHATAPLQIAERLDRIRFV